MTSVQIASTRIAPVQVGLLSQPHHDGSALYVSNLSPEPGDTVTVRIRVPHEAGVVAVHVRTTPDGEPQFADAVVDRLDENETWWRAEIVCHNPVTCYRFVLEGRAMAYQWLNGTGLHLRDVPDAADFRIVTFEAPPAWAADAVVYQVFPDRFARAADRQDRPMPSWAVPAEWDAPVDLSHDGVARQLYGGDLDGVVEHLDHLQSLGVTVLYLTPFFPSRSNHRDDASTFQQVDPVLGGTDALTRLTRAAHARGMKVLGQDLNHEVATQMRRAMLDSSPDLLLIGEHCHDFTLDALGDGWHGVMNYSGFTRPLWTWLRAGGSAANFLGSSLMVPRLGGSCVAETMSEFAALVPWRTVQHSFSLVGSHDTTRIRTLVGEDSRLVDVAAGLMFTMPGIPMMTYGDEIGMCGDCGEDGRRPMPWTDPAHWDARILEVYRGLIAARSDSHALRHGGLRWVRADDEVLVFLRESPEQTALVHCARGP